ncbi:MAG: xanthine dehydrogenase family protein subunit M [Desulfohalobiaceae bacterium]|nr:xanthine dehydrogenase family protein subunit M [Desulfohalobiaceae bacterium]
MMPAFSYIRPNNLDEAVSSLEGRESFVMAGGSDLLGCLRDEVFQADKVVSLSGLEAEFQGIEKTKEGGLRIGALTTITEIAENPVVKSDYPGLAQAASEVASPQLRNQGTIGGNLCQKPRCWYYRGDFPCRRKGGNRCFAMGGEDIFHCIFGGVNCLIVHPSDLAPVLAAFGARVRIAGPAGRRSLGVSRLHVPPSDDPTRETYLDRDEIITAVELPRAGRTVYSSYRKVRARRAWDFALAGVALVLDLDGSRVRSAGVYLSGAAPVPWHSREVEEAITGKNLDGNVIERAAEAVVSGARPLNQNAYKLPLFKGIMREELGKVNPA